MESRPPSVSTVNKPRLNLSIDMRWVALALIVVIVGMLIVWKPWQHTVSDSARTVTVTGDTTVKSEPDEYVFDVSYQNSNTDKAVAIQAAATKSTEIVAKLKALGIADKLIKTTVDGYQNSSPQYTDTIIEPTSTMPTKDGSYIYTLQVSVTLADKSKTQKVQDYLATTGPIGTVTPAANFSETLRKKLEAKARDSATRDARAKADQSAHNLGFKVGRVKSVDDGSGFGGDIIQPMRKNGADLSTKSSAPSLSVQPGENDLSYSVTVVYYIK